MNLTKLRYVACLKALISYGLLAYGHTVIGVVVAMAGQMMFLPWSVTNRCWDMVCLDSFYLCIGLSRLVTL